MNRDEMFAPLTTDPIADATARARSAARGGPTPIVPVPDTAPDIRTYRNPTLGRPDLLWRYDGEGGLVGYVARWDLKGPDGTAKKLIRPLTYCCDGQGGTSWTIAGFPYPRPLYSLPDIRARASAPIVVVEGEKAADAARALLPGCVVTTSPHGARAARTADWSPLRARRVVIIPDADDPGRAYAAEVASLVTAVGAASVDVVDSQRLAAAVVREGRLVPDGRSGSVGWDLADALREGWTPDLLYQELGDLLQASRPLEPAQSEAETEISSDFVIRQDGVYRRKQSRKREEWVWMCSRLEVVARTRNVASEDHGCLLRWVDRDGVVHEWAMPSRLLAGDGTPIREHLLAGGVTISADSGTHSALNDYLGRCEPRATARSVNRIGWHAFGDTRVFVLPDGTVIGNAGAEPVVYQGDGARVHRFMASGTLEGWSAEIAERCIGNSRLLLAVSIGFAGPLLHVVGAESGGVHLYGYSSKGKTTILAVAGSVWGGGGVRGFMQSWRATDNGLEVDAVGHCDTLLCLDELSECDPKAAAASAYMIANGRAKSRADRHGGGRPRGEWRLLFLSTGEVTLAERLAEERVGRTARAGQDVRLLNVPIDAGGRYGAFEVLHGSSDGATFADTLKDAVGRNYGTAGRAYVTWLVEYWDRARELAKRFEEAFLDDHCPKQADGQVKRAAQRFALIAAAGELAVKAGVVPWPAGDATVGIGACFEAWLHARGTPGAVEDAAAQAQVRRFFEQHGESRFTPWDEARESDRPTINRAGFRRVVEERTEWFVLPETWKREICQGLDAKRVARLGVEAGWIQPDPAGSPTSSHRLPGMKPTRVYRVTSDVLQEEG